MLLTLFNQIPDHRRSQGRIYQLPFILLFTVLAIMSGADSYRKVASFINTHFKVLKKRFNVKWRKPPGYTTIRKIIQRVDPKTTEEAFRIHAKTLSTLDPTTYTVISMDGKTIRGSFDHFNDQKAIQVFSVFQTFGKIILGHEMIPDKKTNEIPVAQHLIKELGMEGCLFTADALHCQKKRYKQRKKQTTR